MNRASAGLLFLLFCIPSAFSQVRATTSQTSDSLQRKYRVNFSYEISHIEYREPNVESPDGLVMKETGIMQGISGDIAMFPKNVMIKFDARLSFGKVDYSSLVSGSFPGIRDYQAETRFSLGYVYAASERLHLTPYGGIGLRFLFNGLSAAGPGGYDRHQYYLYSPIGMESVLRIRSGWSLLATAEYDLYWHGWQHSFFPGTIEGWRFDQSNGWGARGYFGFSRTAGRVDFSFGPYFRFWDIADSDVVGGYHEPPNTSKEWGCKIGLGF